MTGPKRQQTRTKRAKNRNNKQEKRDKAEKKKDAKRAGQQVARFGKKGKTTTSAPKGKSGGCKKAEKKGGDIETKKGGKK